MRSLLPSEKKRTLKQIAGEKLSVCFLAGTLRQSWKACNAVSFEAFPQRCLWSVAVGEKEIGADGPQTENMCDEFIHSCFSRVLRFVFVAHQISTEWFGLDLSLFSTDHIEFASLYIEPL